jgi:hypothetical protein
MSTWQIALLVLIGVALAFPLAICICAFLGFLLQTYHRLTTPCPHCAQHRLRSFSGIKETYPTGRNTGTFYVCDACSWRWFWSNDEREFRDASSAEYDRCFPTAHDV